MKIVETGVISSAEVGTARACINFGTVTILHNADLLATYRVGDNKDSDQEQIEFSRSHDNGRSWSKPTNPFIDTVLILDVCSFHAIRSNLVLSLQSSI